MHRLAFATVALCTALGLSDPVAARFEPTRPIELIVPAGTGGGLDIMARTIQGIIVKYNLVRQPVVVLNKAGGAGGEGMLDVKNSRGNPHKIMIGMSNLFTTPIATGIPFRWADLTPVAMLALDEFVLWVSAETPWRSAREFVAALKAAPAGQFKIGGTGAKQEDQIITLAIERATGAKITYIPYRGGGAAAVALVGKQVEATVNNPNEAVAHWRTNNLRPLCVFDTAPIPVNDRVADRAWRDIPTCRSEGLDVEYTMPHGIFLPPGASRDQVEFYVDLMQKVRATPEWNELMRSGAFNPAFLTGAPFSNWLAHAEWRHFDIMQQAGFAVGTAPPRPSTTPTAIAAQTVAPTAAPPAPQVAAPAPPVASPAPQVAPPAPPAAAAPVPQIAAPIATLIDAGRRVALVIGNSSYASVPKLPNPPRDAQAVADTLRRVGFQVVRLENDLGKEKMIAALRTFARESEKADWAMVYYAGHGIEMGGVNYLIPVDAKLEIDRDVDFEAVPLNQVLNAVEGAKRLRLVLLDACRDNPFARQMRRTVATRSVGRGLAAVEPEAGTLVVYAAKHGETALDGDGANSPFATALVRNMVTPGLEVRRLFDFVRDDVMEATNRRQQPFSYGSVPGRQDFFFVQR